MNVNEVIAAMYGDEAPTERVLAKNIRTPSLSPSGIMSTQMQTPNPNLPGVAPIPGRPTIKSLYDQMETINNVPYDFKGLDAVNSAAENEGNSNFAKALAMQMFGGKTMQSPGKALMAESMERSKPIRPNAADIGWTNQETGEFVQNPVMARQQKEKVIAGRIDALVKEQERAANLLVAQGKLEEAATHNRNAEQLKLIMAGIASGNQAIAASLTNAKIQALENKHGATKPLTSKDLDKMTDFSKLYGTVSGQADKFKDEYSPQTFAGKPGVQVENFMESNFPKVMDKIGTKADRKRVTDQAEWWRDQDYYNNLPERHQLFGATLTEGERRSWEGATIQPGMRPEAIRKNLATRKRIMEDTAKRMHDTHIANQRNPAAVRGALSAFGADVLGVEDIDAELARRGVK